MDPTCHAFFRSPVPTLVSDLQELLVSSRIQELYGFALGFVQFALICPFRVLVSMKVRLVFPWATVSNDRRSLVLGRGLEASICWCVIEVLTVLHMPKLSVQVCQYNQPTLFAASIIVEDAVLRIDAAGNTALIRDAFHASDLIHEMHVDISLLYREFNQSLVCRRI